MKYKLFIIYLIKNMYFKANQIKKKKCSIVYFLLILMALSLFMLFAMLFFFPSCSKSFSIDLSKNSFIKDGAPFRYVSGSLHYSRLPSAYWRDRLRKMRASGLDAVQTYVPWNFHEPEEGVFNFQGDADLGKFLQIASEENLLVILRAGPYICAEWDFGGLPGWLLRKDKNMLLRSSDSRYLKPTETYLRKLFKIVSPYIYQTTCGQGSVVMVQLENEYGSFSTCDKSYVERLYDIGVEELGSDIIFFTTDGYSSNYLKCGNLDKRQFATVDFGSSTALNPKAAFNDLRAVQPAGPLVNSEYYAGWLDNWGKNHSRVPASDVAAGLDSLLAFGANVNLYMFFGGTNFAFSNGANCCPLSPQPTSYDYDAPLSEKGDLTQKYLILRNVIGKYKSLPPGPLPSNSTATAYGSIPMSSGCSFFQALPFITTRETVLQYPTYMEALRQYQGFMLYETMLSAKGQATLKVDGLGDRAYVYLRNAEQKTWYCGLLNSVTQTYTLTISIPDWATHLSILVENQGHVNYGSAMQADVKGILGNVSLNSANLTNWHHLSLDFSKFAMNQACPINSESPNNSQGTFYYGIWDILDYPTDTFLLLPFWTKGQVFLNGVNMGRYWPLVGPQRTLYIPATALLKGSNRLVLMELEQCRCVNSGQQGCAAELVDQPDIDGPTTKISPFQEIVERHRKRVATKLAALNKRSISP